MRNMEKYMFITGEFNYLIGKYSEMISHSLLISLPIHYTHQKYIQNPTLARCLK